MEMSDEEKELREKLDKNIEELQTLKKKVEAKKSEQGELFSDLVKLLNY